MPLTIAWSGVEHTFHHLVSDLNGTLAVDGRLVDGVAHRLHALLGTLMVHILTAATHGGTDIIAKSTGIAPVIISSANEKTQYIQALQGGIVALGNGFNDHGMLDAADLAILVIGREGAAVANLNVADIIVHTPVDALDLLLLPQRLTATMRA